MGFNQMEYEVFALELTDYSIQLQEFEQEKIAYEKLMKKTEKEISKDVEV